MKKIDAHQHFWRYDEDRLSWIGEGMSVLKKDFMPPDLRREMNRPGIGMDGCVAVQAEHSMSETDFLLSLANEYDFVEGVVGWLDLRARDLEEQLDLYGRNNLFKGVRHIVQDEPDDRFLLQPDFMRGISRLGEYDLVYDLLIFSRHLPVAVEFTSRFPDQKFVLDHIAKPDIREGRIDDWEQGIRELARHPNTCCKLSGMVTEADWNRWTPGEITPYLDVVFEAFGVDRLMFGSDWPVCLLAASYQEVFQLVNEYVRTLDAEEKRKIMGGNAVRVYGL